MELQGAHQPRIRGSQPQEGRANYFIGNPDQWITDIPLYASVEYRDVYPGVDLVFYSSEGELEYDFTVAPGASASAISLTFQGIDEMRIDGGELILRSGWGELRHRKPRVHEIRNGKRREIGGRFVRQGPKQAGFETDSYDTRNALVIDPVMYGTYTGGTGADSAWALAVDPSGSAYVAGETEPANFPRTFTISNSSGNGDAFLVKMNPAGTGVSYATYFGGTDRDSARGVAVDPAGNAYVTGFTYSTDFPITAGGYRSPSLGQVDAFVIRVNASGTALAYSALIGGAGPDFATGIAIDSVGSAYIAGYTSSMALPVTSGGFQTSFGGGYQDAFVAKLNSSGSGLVYCTYLGGAGNDVANGIAVDSGGEAYVVGYTDSTGFPTKGPVQASAGGQGDAFVAKLSSAGNSLAFSTYLGGRMVDIATSVALDSSGNIYVTGATLSSDFPVTSGAFQTVNQGSYDAFVLKMNSQGTSVMYATYVGGEGSDRANSIAVDANGVAYIAGFAYSGHFPVQSPLESAANGGQDAFTTAVGSTGSCLVWSTYLGGSADDQATGIAVDPAGNVYVAGSTMSSDFPTTAAARQPAYAGHGDGFLIKLAAAVPPQAVSVAPSSGSGLSQTFTFQFSHPGGYGMIAAAALRIAGGDGQDCTLYYALSTATAVWMFNDNDTVWMGPVQAGSGSTLQNSRCSVNMAGTSASGSGTILTLNVPVTFQPVFAGTRTVSVQLTGVNGLYTGMQQLGSWTVPPSNVAPAAVSVIPSSGSGLSQTFTFQFSHPGGYGMIAAAALRIAGGDGQDCTLYYAFSTATVVWMFNDNDTAWMGPLQAGSGNTLQNSRCSVNMAGTSASGSGTILTLNVPVTFQSVFAGTRTVSVQLTGVNGLYTGMQQLGSWTVPPSNVAPTAVSVIPSSGSGLSQTFTFQFSHPGGYGMIAAAALRIAGSDGRDCTLYYTFANSAVMMFNDNDSQWMGPVGMGSGNTLQNSRCSISMAGSSFSGSGTTLTLIVPVTFQSVFAGTRTVSVQLTGINGLYTGMQQLGSWIVL